VSSPPDITRSTPHGALALEAIDVSVVVCTLNRAAALERAVESLICQDTQRTHLEILVVDNGSSDDTASRVAGLARRSSSVRYVREPRLGLSHARNTGIEHAIGSIVAFLDDDAEADRQWVERLLAVFRDGPGVGAAGGRTLVRWPAGRPDWMADTIEGYYGKCDYGEVRRPIRFPEYPFGSNMAIRRQLLLAVNGFRPDLGARGDNLMAGEETDLFERLHHRQVLVMYEPGAVVHHWADERRVTPGWSLRRACKHGVSTAHRTGGADGRSSASAGVPRALWLAAGSTAATVASLARGAGPATTMVRATRAAYWAGYTGGVLSRVWRGRIARR
jgi:GT2 family glycosyltransferase